jgi:hypothetical protein
MRVAILNSHQTKSPSAHDPWVVQTQRAVEYAVAHGFTIVSSAGLNTWELVSWAAGRQSGRLCLVVPSAMTEEDRAALCTRFDFDPVNVEWMTVESDRLRGRKNWWTQRDEAVLRMADLVFPVSVRPGGRIASLLAAGDKGSAIDDSFRTECSPAPRLNRRDPKAGRVNRALCDWPKQTLVHWTRSCHGPWPGEREADFYGDWIRSGGELCHAGFHTLRRIITEQRIRASDWRIGAGEPIVALTELSPSESLPLMRWRPRWGRWSFEPYGIAIDRTWVEQHAFRPVRYVTESEWRGLSTAEKPFCHRGGRGAAIWPAEREWRHAGDVDLATVPVSAVTVIVRDPEEIESLDLPAGWTVLSMFS